MCSEFGFISGESNNWRQGVFSKGVFRVSRVYCLNAIGFVQNLLKVLSGYPSAEKLGNPTQTVGRTALWQNYCADNTPDTRSKPVVRRSLFLVFCTCWESSGSQCNQGGH